MYPERQYGQPSRSMLLWTPGPTRIRQDIARIVPSSAAASSVEAKSPRDDISGDISQCATAVRRVRAQQHERVIARHR